MYPFAARGSHCSYCGAYFLEQETYPRKCVVCEKITYSNPLPVSVSMIKISNGDRIGVLIVQRAIKNDPHFGEWALPGGYLVTGESWEAGAVREVKEEVGLTLDPAGIECYGVANASTVSGSLLIFNTYNRIISLDEIKFEPNEEVSDVDVCFLPSKLAFPSHTRYMEKYLEEING